jgi:hypothetical protein
VPLQTHPRRAGCQVFDRAQSMLVSVFLIFGTLGAPAAHFVPLRNT